MKSTLLCVFIAWAAFGLVSCSKKEKSDWGNKKVDVTAQRNLLKSDDTNQVVAACIELASGGPASAAAVSDLGTLLAHKEPDVRRLAAYALYEIGEKAASAMPVLKESAQKERNPAVLMQIMNTIKNIDPKQAPDFQPANVVTPPK